MATKPIVAAETEHYVIIECPLDPFYGGQEYLSPANRNLVLNIMEQIRAQGWRPMHYENRQQGYVCEKSTEQVEAWNKKIAKKAA